MYVSLSTVVLNSRDRQGTIWLLGHSIPNQHEIDMTSSDFFVICYT